ncbi:pre-mRNA splicing helicase [Nitzschia inconspicua]|uniref:Pre-mRNA splicing helicase n=1 Tax=Nitzschia inconspicua TaxID=303405 RepID=A0A9K3LFS0_9STRA|nr:pre-mRNA splicing helicase [Nitzschia inconspicua]
MFDSDDDDFLRNPEIFRVLDGAVTMRRSVDNNDANNQGDIIVADTPVLSSGTTAQESPWVNTTIVASINEGGTIENASRRNGTAAKNTANPSDGCSWSQQHKGPSRSSYSCFPSKNQPHPAVESVDSSSGYEVESDIVREEVSGGTETITSDKGTVHEKTTTKTITLSDPKACEQSPATSKDNGAGMKSAESFATSGSSSSSCSNDTSILSSDDSWVSNSSTPAKNNPTIALNLTNDGHTSRASLTEYSAKFQVASNKKIPNPYSNRTRAKAPLAGENRKDTTTSRGNSRHFFMANDSESGDESSLSSGRSSNDQNQIRHDPTPTEENLKTSVSITNLSSPSDSSTSVEALVQVLHPNLMENPTPDIEDYRPKNKDDEEPEIDPSFYAPSVRQQGSRPLLKEYNSQTHPPHVRRKVSVASLFAPPMDRLWTGKFQEFNHFQSEMAKWICDTDDNVVVSAPTGAGKSTIFEIAMARFLTIGLVAQGDTAFSSQKESVSKARKIIYIAPSKALCEERYEDWSRRLQALQLGIEVAMITGDAADPGLSFSDLAFAHLIITTPEKWDSMTRRWQENFYLIASVKLMLVDEVHLLGDKDRGWCLETIVCRMKTISRAAQSIEVDSTDISRSSYPATNPDAIKMPFRMVAVSATLPNISEVAEFFHANEAYSFDDSYRPIPLATHVIAMGNRGRNEWKFWNNMGQHVPEVIKRFSNGKQSLIFCHTKKETEKIAELLIQRRAFGNKNVNTSAKPGTRDYFLDHGIGYHHAGLEKDERRSIEQAFAEGKITCLASTSTLATGVNLPAHLVLIVGSRTWRGNGNGYENIETSQLLQMIGRAGRPGLDSSGTAVILTDNESRTALERQLKTGLCRAQSQLLSRLPEVLNSEISSLVVQSFESAISWLRSTFLFCCLDFHGPSEAISTAQKICREAIQQLHEIGLVEMNGNRIEPQPGCHIMSRQLITVDAMKTITSWPSDATQYQILRSISMVKDLHQSVRRNEKKELREIHKTDIIKFKISKALSKFTVQDESQKAFILLQAIISQHEFQNQTLKQEMASLTNGAAKILSAAQEYCIRASKFGNVARLCFILHRSLMVCLWGVDSGVLNQINGVGMTCVKLLRQKGIFNFRHVVESTEKDIERAAGRKFPFGRELKTTVQELLRDNLDLSAKIEFIRGSGRPDSVVVTLNDPGDSTDTIGTRNGDPTVSHTIIVYSDSSAESVLLCEENITKPCSFRVPLPQGVRKIHLTKLASVVGLDDSLVLGTDGEADDRRSAGTEGIAKNERKLRPDSSPKPESSERNLKTRQLEVPFIFSKKRKSFPRPGMEDPSPTITPNRDEIPDHSRETRTREQNWRQDNDFLHETERPLSQNTQSSRVVSTFWQRRASASEPPINITPPMYEREPRVHKPRDNNPHEDESSSDVRERPKFTAVTREDSFFDWFNPSRNERNVMPFRDNEFSRDTGGNWSKTLQSASKSQQRAFTGKKENPFRSFTHDPNDSEGRLKDLSQNKQQFSSRQFKRTKNCHLERRATSTNQRAYLRQTAAELEENRQRIQFARFDQHFAPPHDASGYSHPSNHSAPTLYRPTLEFGHGSSNSRCPHYPQIHLNDHDICPSQKRWYSPKVALRQHLYATPSELQGNNYQIIDPFLGIHVNPEASSPYPTHGYFQHNEFDTRNGQCEEHSRVVPPSEIGFHGAPQECDRFIEQSCENRGKKFMEECRSKSTFYDVNDAFGSYF